MRDQLNVEVCAMLQRYLDGELSNAELQEWLAQIEYDDDVSGEERDELARVRLIAVEVAEQRRPPDAVLESVAAALAAFRPAQVVLAFRSASATVWEGEPVFSAAPSRPQRVGISP